MNLQNMSIEELNKFSRRALTRAEDLARKVPTYQMARDAGVRDIGYSTTANGWVSSYTGEAIIKMGNGDCWKAVGRGPEGDAATIHRKGFIEFIPVGVTK